MATDNGNREFTVTWAVAPGSRHQASLLGVDEVREQLRLITTPAPSSMNRPGDQYLNEYKIAHQDETAIVEFDWNGEDGDYREVRRFTPAEFLAHADEQGR